ncbi:hypothetical protein EHE19_008295 [Ruminiclostridium herbifermentans]|uniref:Magnesium transporter MgtE intracellular domain-containing protein n=1 Tax=Ruminiclostridium herbifermentans TaxID=2488810 RepID=A0A4U7JL33_9FIRM|nr:hypothetical protein [Ruminiclostridium herbifermentans]QNU68389.1 hypothetical protein EHE19_008295 [Ruminiclostridium herbifermentans]
MAETKNDNIENSNIDINETLKNLSKSPNGNKGKGKDSEKGETKNSALFYIVSILSAILLVVLIIGGVFFFAIKNNVNGIADRMDDTIQNIPILRLALPEKPDIEDEKNMTEEEVRAKYRKLRTEKLELEKQITDLNSQLEQINKQISAKDTNSSLLQQQMDALEKEKLKLISDNDKLQKDFQGVTNAIAKGDTAAFKAYYEKIDPETAAKLYAEILQDEKISADVKKYCAIYEEMDAGNVAAIMEEMGTGKMTLIVEILKNLKKDKTAEIISEMTPAFAANVSEQLAKVYNLEAAKSEKK